MSVPASTNKTPKNEAPKKVFIKTFGCQMNEYDSDKMADVLVHLAAEGFDERVRLGQDGRRTSRL